MCYNMPRSQRWVKDGSLQKGVAMNRKSKRGISYLEYALLAALVGIVGAVGVMKYGKAISDFFSTMATKTADVTPKK